MHERDYGFAIFIGQGRSGKILESADMYVTISLVSGKICIRNRTVENRRNKLKRQAAGVWPERMETLSTDPSLKIYERCQSL
jgi:hypothetical protein